MKSSSGPLPVWPKLIQVATIAACGVMVAIATQAQTVSDIVEVGSYPDAVAVNPVTNKIYVANEGSNNVTVIDGATNSTTVVPTGNDPVALAVNSMTNKIYVVNAGSNSVTVIDGATNDTTTVAAGVDPGAIAINQNTNKIYVANQQSVGPILNNGVTIIDGVTNTSTTLAAASTAVAIAVNSLTNKIYAVNWNTLTVFDGATGAITTVPVGEDANSVAVNPVTNKIYVANSISTSITYLTVIDGATNAATPIYGLDPASAVVVNPSTNKIYVSHYDSLLVLDGATGLGTSVLIGLSAGPPALNLTTNEIFVSDRVFGDVAAINGATNAVTDVPAGDDPTSIAVNQTTNKVYVDNTDSNTVTVIDGQSGPPPALQFIPLTPCRIADTRTSGPLGGPELAAASERDFYLPLSSCGVPATALAYSLNVTVIPDARLSYLTIWPRGESQPLVSLLNSDGRIKANAAIVAAGASGAVAVYASDPTQIILDINGYFVGGGTEGLAFYPLTPCRVADTRSANGPLGAPFLKGGVSRSFPILASPCNIPNSAQAYSLNLTAIPHSRLDYLSTWPTGQPQPAVSTLNSPGAVTASAAIVAAGTNGAMTAYASNDSDLVIDVNGYFAPQGVGGLSLYAVQPCRLLDTRASSGRFTGTLATNLTASTCSIPASAQAYVLNATVVPPRDLHFLTLLPNGEPQPPVSTLNSDGSISSNMAIVPNLNGSVNAYATDPTQLILDLSAYFAPWQAALPGSIPHPHVEPEAHQSQKSDSP